MAESKPSLFNRTYLKIVAWIIAIAIVLLTAGQNRSPDYLKIERHETTALYYIEQDDAAYLHIGLLFRTSAAINSDQQLLQTLLLQVVQQQLDSIAEQALFARLKVRLGAQATPDRIKVSIAIPKKYSAQSENIKKVTESLIQQLQDYFPRGDIEQRLNRLEAEQYLSQKGPENQLLNHFFNQLVAPASVHPLQRFSGLYRSSINPATLTLTLQGPDLETLPQMLSSLLPDYQSSYQVSSAITATTIAPGFRRLQPKDNQSYLLTGQALPGRQQDNFALELLAVKTLQQLLQQPGLPESRLTWKSLDKQGYLAIILHGPKVSADSRVNDLMQPILDQLDDQVISTTRNKLLDDYNKQMEQTSNQLSQLDTIAFYQLPVDDLARFEKQLTQADNQQVKDFITDYLTGSEQYQLLLPAY